MPDETALAGVLNQRSIGDFVDYVDLRGVGIYGGRGAGGLRGLHGNVLGVPHACAAGS